VEHASIPHGGTAGVHSRIQVESLFANSTLPAATKKAVAAGYQTDVAGPAQRRIENKKYQGSVVSVSRET
jgi:hypothetical protein